MILTAMLLTCCSSESEVKAQETQPSSSEKVLVAYFSFTSNTKAYAEKIAEMTGGDLYEIVPEVAYGSENSNYYDETTRAYKEQYVIRISGHQDKKRFTVRKISSGVGVERIFPMESPFIDSIQVNKLGVVRRAKLYYLRNLTGKKARIKEKRQ